MQNSIYATYKTPEKADGVFLEALQQGAELLDLVVITRHTYQDLEFKTNSGHLHVTKRSDPIEAPVVAEGKSRCQPINNEHPTHSDPFEVQDDGICLLDNWKYRGDLANCLEELGFEAIVAREIETSILLGGAVLILRVPSGNVTSSQAIELIEGGGGTIRVPQMQCPV